MKFARSLLMVAVMAAPSFASAAPPAAGTPEESIRESLKLIRDGKLDEWISTWCAPEKCTNTPTAIDELKQFGLARAQKGAPLCLKGSDDSIDVTRVKGDPGKDTSVTVWIKCEESRLPVPATVKKVDNKWLVTSFSW